jgi:hypothetical protein
MFCRYGQSLRIELGPPPGAGALATQSYTPVDQGIRAGTSSGTALVRGVRAHSYRLNVGHFVDWTITIERL